MTGYAHAFVGIVVREWLRFVRQRGRFLAALVRPLVWLVIFAAGFRTVLGLSPTPPYRTYIAYEDYVVPGLIGMILLFNGMQAALAIVYDREMGSMKVLLTSPLPRAFLLTGRLAAASLVAEGRVEAVPAVRRGVSRRNERQPCRPRTRNYPILVRRTVARAALEERSGDGPAHRRAVRQGPRAGAANQGSGLARQSGNAGRGDHPNRRVQPEHISRIGQGV